LKFSPILMADVHTKEQRSFNMSRIKGKHAKGDTGEPKLNQFFFK